MTSPEHGPNPEEMGQENKSEDQDKKPQRIFKIIRPGESKKLDIKLDDFKAVPKETETGEETKVEKQSITDWAEDLRGHVKANKQGKLTERDRAREDIKRLFGDKE